MNKCRGGGENKADYTVIILDLYYLIIVTEFIMGSNEATKYTEQKNNYNKAFNGSARRLAYIMSRWFPDDCTNTLCLWTNASYTLNTVHDQQTDLLLVLLCDGSHLLPQFGFVSFCF